MLQLETDMEGKQMYFGHATKELKKHGFIIGGNWEYDSGLFDGVIHKEGAETIYVRLPFKVVTGELDRSDALIEFEKPFVIKHVVHIGLDKDENSLLSVSGFNQFQKPIDKDGELHHKHALQEFGEEIVGGLLDHI